MLTNEADIAYTFSDGTTGLGYLGDCTTESVRSILQDIERDRRPGPKVVCVFFRWQGRSETWERPNGRHSFKQS